MARVTQLGLDFERAGAPRRPRSFHVRSHQTVPEAQAGEAAAQRQEDSILGYFQAFRHVPAVAGAVPGRWTPSEVAAMFPAWPVTSVRRALTNLTKGGQLVHHPADRRPGPHGAKESTWSLSEEDAHE